MKKVCAIFLLIVLLMPAFFLSGCEDKPALNNYQISVDFDSQNKTAQCACTVDYVNNSSNAFDYLLFHLYPNAFSQQGEGLVCSPANETKTYPNGISYGGIQIDGVQVGGKQAQFTLQGEADMLLKVSLENQLFPDERVQVEMQFALVLPNASHRFGYGDDTVNFANFYPIACVYRDGEGFATDGYIANGDPFFSDVANYVVSVDYSQSYTLACSGTDKTTALDGDRSITTFSNEKVRDVSFVLSQNFNMISAKSRGCEIEYYFFDDGNAQNSLETAVKAMGFYSQSFGDYPYSSLAVVQTNFVHGGMEYPRLVMISNSVASEDYAYVIAHEIAHQWWYGVVGNDEYNHAWLDESLTEFSTALFFENYPEYGISYNQIVSGAEANYKFFLQIYKKIQGDVDTSMLRPLDEFATEPEYVNNIYTRGILMFDALKNQLGSKKLTSTLKAYFKQYAFKNVSSDEFIEFFSAKAGAKLQKFFDSWLNGDVVFVYA